MQLPSLNHIAKKTTSTLQRFPLALLSAAIAVVIAIYMVEFSEVETQHLFNVVLVSLLGIPLFTTITLASEKGSWSAFANTAVQLSAIFLLIPYYFWLPTDLDYAPYSHVYRYILYVIGIHLLVAIGPYWKEGEVHAFWQFNKTLFLRFLTAVFFSGVLFAGLSIALLSIDVLLGISIDEKRYLQLFFFMGGIFNTWFFLAGIPSSIEKFGTVKEYPKGLKIFTQNILIPLVITYVIILYLYAGKITFQWSWPEGWVAILILCFSIAGILALLLLYPIQDKVENRWIKRFSTAYFWALVPLVILLLLAIYRRVWEYGVTVERYFVIVLGFWLAGIVTYFLFSKTKNIKVIPASLCIIAFFVSFGPWGAFSFSERSQINRLERYLNHNNILQEGSIQKITEPIPGEDENQIGSIVHYLNDTHGLDGIQPWFQQDLSSLTTNTNKQDSTSSQRVNHYNRPRYVVELMGLEYNGSVPLSGSAKNHYEFYTDQNVTLDVNNVNWIIHNLYWSPERVEEHAINNGQNVFIESNEMNPHIRIYLENEDGSFVNINLEKIIEELSGRFRPPSQKLSSQDMAFRFTADTLAATLYFSRISWSTEEDSISIETASFDLGIE